VCAFHTLSRGLLAHLLRQVGASALAVLRETGELELEPIEALVVERRAEIGPASFDGAMARFEGWLPARLVDDGRAGVYERMVRLAHALMTLAWLDVELLEPVDLFGDEPFPTLDTVDGVEGPFVEPVFSGRAGA